MSCGMSCGNSGLFSIYFCVKNQNTKSVSTVPSLPYTLEVGLWNRHTSATP